MKLIGKFRQKSHFFYAGLSWFVLLTAAGKPENRREANVHQSESQRSEMTDGRSSSDGAAHGCLQFGGSKRFVVPTFLKTGPEFGEIIAWVTPVFRLRRDVTEDLSQVRRGHIQAWQKVDFLLLHQKMRRCDCGCWCDYFSSQTELQSSKQAPSTRRRENLCPNTTSEEKKGNLNNWADLFILQDDSKPEWWHRYSRPKCCLVQMKQHRSLILCSFSRFSGIKFCKSQILNESEVFWDL